MKRGFPTDPALINFAQTGHFFPAARTPTRTRSRLVELRPVLKGRDESDSGIGHSLLGASYETSMQSSWSSGGAELTPKSSRSDASLHTPQPPSCSKRYRIGRSDASPCGGLRACANEASGSGISPILGLSKAGGVSEYRFDGSQISSICGSSGLTKLGSPQTDSLQTPKTDRRFGDGGGGAGVSRKLDIAPSRPQTPSKCLPFSPTKELGQSDFLGGFTNLATSTPLRTDDFAHMPLDGGMRPVLPLGSPLRKRAAPLTPTPIKRAMAFFLDSKATPPKHAAEARSHLADVQEIIRKDSNVSCHGIEYSTPSKMMRWDGDDLSFLGSLDTLPPQPLLRSPLASLSNAHFQPPPFTPEKMSAAWCRIALGKTSPQRELTEQARLFLEPSLRAAPTPQLTPDKLTYAQL